MKAALLVYCGDKILSIDENGAEPEGDFDEYKKLIAKLSMYTRRKTRDCTRGSDLTKPFDNRINLLLNTNSNIDDSLKSVTFTDTTKK
jgi:hypothetical protein